MTYTVDIIAQLETGALVLRDFVTVHGKTLGGAAASFTYWTGEDNVAQNVVPPSSETPVSRNFIGGGTLVEVPPVVDVIGVEAYSAKFGFDQTTTSAGSPMDMVFGNNIRAGQLEYHQGVFNPDTWAIIDTPVLLFSGRVDGAELDEPSVDPDSEPSEGRLNVAAVSEAIYLTYTNPAVESHAQQKLRSGDDFRLYGDTATERERWWGTVQGS